MDNTGVFTCSRAAAGFRAAFGDFRNCTRSSRGTESWALRTVFFEVTYEKAKPVIDALHGECRPQFKELRRMQDYCEAVETAFRGAGFMPTMRKQKGPARSGFMWSGSGLRRRGF
jgi:hypothetical protein